MSKTIIGAGLIGSLFSIYLRRKGYPVHVYERRPDMRKVVVDGGRSINLVITEKGLHALDLLGLKEKVLSYTVPVYGRMMHDLNGELTYQSYGVTGTECNYSISRAELNKILITLAENEGAHFHFNHRLLDIDFDSNEYIFQNDRTEGIITVVTETAFGTDGAPSVCRTLMNQCSITDETITPLGHDYKELLIPADLAKKYELKLNALHIWPRGHHMMMALPNLNGSFTVTLYLPENGDICFGNLSTEAAVLDYFKTYYPDAIQLIPTLTQDFLKNPVGKLATVRCYPWHYKDKIALIGDSAHGVVPFFGQGMNAGFDDCVVLEKLMQKYPNDWEKIFALYTEYQKPNGDAIADMAIANLQEMSEKVADKQFLLEKQVEKIIAQAFPQKYLPRYSMITHTTIPYSICQKVGVIQEQLLKELSQNLNRPEEVDLQKALSLIDERLKPYQEFLT